MSFLGYSAKEVRESNNIPPEKLGFSIVFAKNWPSRTSRPPNLSPRSITTLPMQLINKQTDPTSVLVENEHQS